MSKQLKLKDLHTGRRIYSPNILGGHAKVIRAAKPTSFLRARIHNVSEYFPSAPSASPVLRKGKYIPVYDSFLTGHLLTQDNRTLITEQAAILETEAGLRYITEETMRRMTRVFSTEHKFKKWHKRTGGLVFRAVLSGINADFDGGDI